MDQGSVFQSKRGQAVLLPKASAFSDDVKRVDVIAIGRNRIIAPAGEAWDNWFDGKKVSADFMLTRDQPAAEQQKSF